MFDDMDQFPRVWDINELRNRPQAQWLIQNMVEENGLCVFFGPDKVGKTAALSNFLWAWTAGHDQFLTDDFAMTGEDRRVLYVLLEGQASFYSRYDAWCHAYNDGKRLEGFFVMDEGLSLYQGKMEWENPATWTPSAQKLWNAVDFLKPTVLVIDTLSRATAGMDENSPQMAQVVGMLDNIRDVFNVATFIVHHTALSEGDRPRGHSSLKGAASSYVRIEGKPEDEVLKLVTGPHRNSDGFLRVSFLRQSERASFVVGVPGPGAGNALQDRLYRMVLERQAPVALAECTEFLYGEDTRENRKKVGSIYRNHPNLTHEDGHVRVVASEKPEDI